MKKKRIKTKLFTSLSVIIIILLISAASQNMISTEAQIDTNENQYDLDSFDRSAWKWSTTEVVSTESTSDSYSPSLATDADGNVHIAWVDYTDYGGSGSDYDIFHKCWDASSTAWTSTEVVSTESTSDSWNPSLATDADGNVHIAWYDFTDYAGSGPDYDIFYKRWDASSSVWTTTEIVSTESTSASYSPSLATDTAGNVHIVWYDATNYAGSGIDYDIFYKRWDAFTSSWTTTEVASTESTLSSYYPTLATDTAGNAHIAWYEDTDTSSGIDYDIFYKCWDAFTSLWTTAEIVSTESTENSYDPSITVDADGNVHITWYDFTDYAGSGIDLDIFYKRWDASSSLWTITEVVSTESTDQSGYPSLVVDNEGNVHIAWYDSTDYVGAGIDYDIFYKRWDASSSLWTITEVVSTESTSDSYRPSLAVDAEGKVHIAWVDETDYAGSGVDIDIFYKQFADPPVAPELAFIVPNPTESDTIYLDWNNVLEANSYYVYRSTSYIWSVEGLNPITTVTSSEYIDILSSAGYYYYVIVAENFAGNSSHSNCQYVEVIFPDLAAPELAPIRPNPTELSSVSLVWDDVDGATEYFVYRSASYIWSVEGLTPIATVVDSDYIDALPSQDYYFYVIVATDGVTNSTISNCEYIEYKLPTLHEFFILSSMIIGLPILLLIVTRKRRKNSKQS